MLGAVAAVLAYVAATGADSGDAKDKSAIYLDNTEWLADYRNVIVMHYPDIAAGFARPNRTDSAHFAGRDWTKPYPGSALESGFGAHLRVAFDVPIPDSPGSVDQVTALSAVTYSIPESLMDGATGLPKRMHPSWYICQHHIITTLPDPAGPIHHGCGGFLPPKCLDQLRTMVTRDWAADPSLPCSGFALDLTPEACDDSVGMVRQDVFGMFVP